LPRSLLFRPRPWYLTIIALPCAIILVFAALLFLSYNMIQFGVLVIIGALVALAYKPFIEYMVRRCSKDIDELILQQVNSRWNNYIEQKLKTAAS
jgi:membrane protein implicated in regulation of membrane protease activity